MIKEQLKEAKKACRSMQNIKPEIKNKALRSISEALIQKSELIIEENQKDIVEAENNGIKESMIDRLLLNKERIEAMAQDILKVIDLQDPIGTLVREIKRPNGLVIQQIRIPLGVIGVIYESRPNVTVDIASLCIKTNNVCVLKGGKEAIHSNRILVQIINEAIKNLLPTHAVTLIETKHREETFDLIQAHDYVDVIIPRGSAGLIQYVVKNATVPVIETGAGICHLYVDQEANLDMALEIAKNAKIQIENIKNGLIEIDSDNKNYYQSNYNLYANRLDELDNKIKISLSNIKNRNLIITHPAFGHFCKEYSLNQIAIARDEADPKAMADIITFIKNNNVKAIFYEEFSSSKLVDSIAKETKAKTLTLNPIESLSKENIEAGEDYFSIMEKNIISLTNGLN